MDGRKDKRTEGRTKLDLEGSTSPKNILFFLLYWSKLALMIPNMADIMEVLLLSNEIFMTAYDTIRQIDQPQ